MNKQISPKIVSLVFSVLILCFVIGFYAIAWTPPSENPPGGNVNTPLNVGPDAQYKEGGLILNTGGASNGLIVEKGKVAIGTTSPLIWTKVDIVSDCQQHGLAIRNTNSQAKLLIAGEDDNDDKSGGTYAGLYFGDSSYLDEWGIVYKDDDSLQIANWSPGMTTRMTFTSDGKVGIGTTNPEDELQVLGNFRIGSGTNGDAIRFEQQNPPYVDHSFHRIAFSELRFWDWGIGKDMVTFNDGKVGIGTTNPSYKLDVEGKIQATAFDTGDITFRDQKTKKILWRMFEKEDGLYLENVKTGKIYRFLLEEVNE